MKKKVIVLVVDTELTNEQIESGSVYVRIDPKDPPEDWKPVGSQLARNVRVLDSD